MGEVESSRTAATDVADALLRWRSWAQFVWLGGGPITQSDDDLRHAVCQQFDEEKALRDDLLAACKRLLETKGQPYDHDWSSTTCAYDDALTLAKAAVAKAER